MKLLQEITIWKTPTLNHIYIFDGSSSKTVGYIPFGKMQAFKFSTPFNFDKRGRKFVEVKALKFDMSQMRK